MSFEISATTFESILRSLRSDPQGSGSDHRKMPRVGLSGRVTIIPVSAKSDRSPVVAMVRDLSTGGIGLASAKSLKSGEQIIVRFAANGREPPKAILCSVTHSHPVDERLFTIGVKFVRDIEIVQPPVDDD
jgi:c-di-GMP-binding flagellar brake protein YcgR